MNCQTTSVPFDLGEGLRSVRRLYSMLLQFRALWASACLGDRVIGFLLSFLAFTVLNGLVWVLFMAQVVFSEVTLGVVGRLSLHGLGLFP